MIKKRDTISHEESKIKNIAVEDEFAKSSGDEVMIKSDPLKFIKTYRIGNWEHKVYPNMIIFRSLIALFIGIFLQLIVQEKTITAPI